LSSKPNTSSSINQSEYPAAGRRVQSTPTSNFKSAYKYLLRRGASGSDHQSPGTALKLFFDKQRRVHTMSYRGTQSQPQSNPDHHQHHQGHFMPRRTSTNSSGDNELLEEGTPTLPTLTRAQHRRFIVEQRIIISALIEDYSLERAVFYTTVDTPTIVHNDVLGDILGVEDIIYAIIFDQESRNIFVFYTRDLPEGTFTRFRGEHDNIPEGPPQYNSDGVINTDEESDAT
jgi:hypothetical protein